MRAHRRRREQIRCFMVPTPPQDRLNAVAERAFYLGSQEHKNHPSFAGAPGLRLRPEADATPCDPCFADQQEMLTSWLREAIRAGQVSALWEGDFPRYVWVRIADVVYEARLVNQGNGAYKGYSLQPHEYPENWR